MGEGAFRGLSAASLWVWPWASPLPTYRVWFSVFIAWLLKAMILRYGDPRLYLRLRPFFPGSYPRRLGLRGHLAGDRRAHGNDGKPLYRGLARFLEDRDPHVQVGIALVACRRHGHPQPDFRAL